MGQGSIHGPVGFVFFLLLSSSVCQSADHSQTGSIIHRLLTKVSDRTFGSQRLGPAWTDTSLAHCVASCFSRYASKCQTVMFNPRANLCTPGSFIRKSQSGSTLAPTRTEGFLYAARACDTSDEFEVLSSAQASACVRMSNVSLNHQQAKEFCTGLGAHLFVARSMEKLNLLPHGVRILIGLTDTETEGVFVWDDNGDVFDPALNDLIFRAGEPSNYNDSEDCVTVIPNSLTPSGNDIACSIEKFTFACERPMLV
ncbi:hypothetical protein EGW08_021060 [Elysia chlorotica]|uniref:C-type lectin domain-containing protein n=1 Tax=Elysia chlorotica TaxID=188477 RepID=A0A3S1AZG8_ELYCH|nr:hypothetical protein EGW08_021060 [Elysia chlorotica]